MDDICTCNIDKYFICLLLSSSSTCEMSGQPSLVSATGTSAASISVTTDVFFGQTFLKQLASSKKGLQICNKENTPGSAIH